MHIQKTTKYLKDVTLKKQCVPFRHYNGGVGRCAQAKQWGWMQGRWHKKSAEFLQHVLKNAESNVELKGLDVDSLVIEHIEVKKSPQDVVQDLQSSGSRSRRSSHSPKSLHFGMVLDSLVFSINDDPNRNIRLPRVDTRWRCERANLNAGINASIHILVKKDQGNSSLHSEGALKLTDREEREETETRSGSGTAPGSAPPTLRSRVPDRLPVPRVAVLDRKPWWLPVLLESDQWGIRDAAAVRVPTKYVVREQKGIALAQFSCGLLMQYNVTKRTLGGCEIRQRGGAERENDDQQSLTIAPPSSRAFWKVPNLRSRTAGSAMLLRTVRKRQAAPSPWKPSLQCIKSAHAPETPFL
ncbi:hypothetical protein Celaphus_00015123 [Cervus elaphus hippelaphus]|uniref:Large ribosomal subunit protein uL22 n=1 Tax=Cervus elaphus hippelaphus TaxID=46360 RepID=A0A212CSW8_CEREH|nr:hypothetical protein Celaphus_00015123 [Cervus elaphus hippelaphus]